MDPFLQSLPNSQRGWFVRGLLTEEDNPYIWGGQGWIVVDGQPFEVYDCSGLIVAKLIAAGRYKGSDLNSGGLWAHFAVGGAIIATGPLNFTKGANAAPGALFFWASDPAKPSSIYHVAASLGNGMMIEAGGGTSKTTTVDAAIKSAAMVRVVPFRPCHFACDPFPS